MGGCLTVGPGGHYPDKRDEGRPSEHMLIEEDQNVLTDEDCERIREVLRQNMEAAESRSSAAK